jgi:hypothetical protein
MKLYEVTITVTSYYKVVVKAQDREHASELAEEYAHDNYSYNGDLESELIKDISPDEEDEDQEGEVISAEKEASQSDEEQVLPAPIIDPPTGVAL